MGDLNSCRNQPDHPIDTDPNPIPTETPNFSTLLELNLPRRYTTTPQFTRLGSNTLWRWHL